MLPRNPLPLLLLLLVPLGACGDDDPVTPEPEIADVQVSPATASLDAVGATTQFTATATDTDGQQVLDATFTWSSSDESVATVDATGTVTGAGAGEAQITATADGVSGSAMVTVDQAVAGLELTPSDTTVRVGGTVTYEASALDANDNPINGATVAWSSSDAAIATVDDSGLATAQAIGTATITAESDGVTATASLTVNAAVGTVEITPDSTTFASVGDTVRLATTIVDTEGDTITDETVAWTSSDEAVASVSETGTVTAVADGSATVTASVGSITDTALVVVAQEVSSLTVTPDSVGIEVGDTTLFSASANDANENPVLSAELMWSSSDSSVATVDSLGQAIGQAEGTAWIMASGAGMVDSATLVVSPPAPTATMSVVSGGDQNGVTQEDFGEPLIVEILDGSGMAVAGGTVRWEVLQGSVTLSDSVVTTDTEGRGSVTVTAGTTTEDALIQAISPDAAGEPVTITLRTSVMAVQIVDNAFIDAEGRQNGEFEANIEVGDTLRFTYDESGGVTHTVTSSDTPDGGSSFDSGELQPGDTFEVIPGIEGTWTFLCEIHPGTMSGATIDVSADSDLPQSALRGGFR